MDPPHFGARLRCPYCGHPEDKVVDSRSSRGGDAIRRRRECLHCAKRYTTYEHIEEVELTVAKKDGRREAFDRRKVLSGLRKACEKRPIPLETMESTVEDIEKQLQSRFEKEISSTEIGELVMQKLHAIDPVAYVRFASVYRQFADIEAFSDVLKKLQK